MWRPHTPIPVEATFDEFVRNVGGEKVSDFLPPNPHFSNADYLFARDGVVAELKEITTEFSKADGVFEKQYGIVREFRQRNEISWGDLVRGGPFPPEYHRQQLRLFRPPIQRILKKANRQIKETKAALDREDDLGLLLLVNDGFTSISPLRVSALVAESLVHSYKSITAFVYMTVNTYVDVPSSEYAALLWVTAYDDNAPDQLVTFVDDLGRAWRKFLEKRIGPLTGSRETQDRDILKGAKAIKWHSRDA